LRKRPTTVAPSRRGRYRTSVSAPRLPSQERVSVAPRGDVQAIHYNTRSAAPFRIPEEEVGAYYRAYQRFGRMLEDERYRIRFKLDPGDLFIVDNLRVLHGRTGYSESGERHLQGCYADRDGLRSTLAILSR